MDRKHNSSINNIKFLVPNRPVHNFTQSKIGESQATIISEEQKPKSMTFGATEQQSSTSLISERPTASINAQTKQQALEFQIKKNHELANKLSPIFKYKIQEFLRKKRSRCPQRRKFSIRHGALQRFGKNQFSRLHTSLQTQQSQHSQDMPFPPIVPFASQPALNHFMINGDIDLD